MNLKTLGWNTTLEQQFEELGLQKCVPGRVALEHRNIYRVFSQQGEVLAEAAGKMRYEAHGRADFPAVGDWVALSLMPGEQRAIIQAVLPRKSKFSRKVAGAVTEEQIVAANIDTVFLLCALQEDFNTRRIERYLVMAWESGANPVLVLSKADLCQDRENKIRAAQAAAMGVPVHVISTLRDMGLEEIKGYLREGETAAFLGSSGVGKSTLLNALLGEELQKVQEIRADDGKGRHTTTYRQLFVLPRGGMVIDTPGMRELQLWEAGEGLAGTFPDIEELARGCYFKDCRHHQEPRCAVREAMEKGLLEEARFASYLKLQKELAYLERKNDEGLQRAEEDRWKQIHKEIRSIYKDKYRR